MRYHAVAVDFDGTLAHDGRVLPAALEALARLRETGRRLVLVTGRELPDLMRLLPDPGLFDRIVAENGGLLVTPSSGEVRPLGPPPPPELMALLNERGVEPLSVGQVVVATWEPHQGAVLDAIRVLGLEHHIVFNKGAVMVLPPGIGKGSGLAAALRDLGLSPRNAVAVGDAENDHAMFDLAQRSVAVHNALPAVRLHADMVTNGDHGWGVVEVADRLLEGDMASVLSGNERHAVVFGEQLDGGELMLPEVTNLLIAGPPGSGKSTLAAGLIERLSTRDYQYCVIDPEGDYELSSAITIGDASRAPLIPEVVQILDHPDQCAVVCMLGVPYKDRPDFYSSLLYQVDELRRIRGRPHWLVADEAHHMLPNNRERDALPMSRETGGNIFITVDPGHLTHDALSSIEFVVAVGADASTVLDQAARALGAIVPEATLPSEVTRRMALVWSLDNGTVEPMTIVPPRAIHRRHRRKYAHGDVGPERSFYFRGPGDECTHRAANLVEFIQIADRLSDDTWSFHLHRGDYTRWMEHVICDGELADLTRELERRDDLPIPERRLRLRHAIESAYTLPV